MKPSKRKNHQILYDETEKQAFKKNKSTKKGYVAYTCCEPGCNARIYRYASGTCKYSPDYQGHNLSSTAAARVAEYEFKATMAKAAADLSQPGKLAPLADIFTAASTK